MRLLELIAYHGSRNGHEKFSPSHQGDNSTAFGAYHSNRIGVFFTDNPEFAKLYGDVKKYDLNIHTTATDLHNLAYDFAQTLDAHDPNERNDWLAMMHYARGGLLWELFDDEMGEMFVPWLISQGYDSAQFEENNVDDNGNEVMSNTTVVFDPSLVSTPISEKYIPSEHALLNASPTALKYLGKKKIKKIRKVRDEIRHSEGGGGMCSWVAEDLAERWGWERMSGTYCHKSGDIICVAHNWNILPDGSILDSTADQFGEGYDIDVITPDDPRFSQYRYEWFQDFHPGMKDYDDEIPEPDPRWNGILDDDWVDQNPRPDGWWLDKDGKDRKGNFYKDQLTYYGYNTPSLQRQSDDFEKTRNESLTEAFFGNHLDILMPIINELMRTAARPLIYRLWKRSKHSVLALAAIKHLHDQGDPNPITTLSQLADIDVPMSFLNKLAHEAGILTESANGVLESIELQHLDSIADTILGMGEGDVQTLQDYLDEYVENGGDANSSEFISWVTPRIIEDIKVSYQGINRQLSYHGGKIEIFRAISAPSDWVKSGQYSKRNLGIYWSYEQSQAQVYWGDPKVGADIFVVHGLIDESQINWYDTMVASQVYGVDEAELQLFTNADVEVVGIYKDGDNTNLISSKQMLTAAESPTAIVYHATFSSNIPSIRKNGLKSQIGKNSADFGEPDYGVHVFYDMDTLEDAVANWNMDWHEHEGEPLSVITLRIPTEWIIGPSDSGYGMIASSIPPSMIVDVVNNI